MNPPKYTAFPRATIEGQIEQITYCNPETHFTVARLKPNPLAAAITVSGYLAGVRVGETLKIKGQWHSHPKYGPQFRISTYDVILPATVDGIRSYLQSGVIKGIGSTLAARLLQAFGADTLHIIEKVPERLTEVSGIGDMRAAKIVSAWQDYHALRGLMQFLQEMGVQPSFCGKIFKKYGPDAVTLIREDPYVLAQDFPTGGFLIGDAVARKLGTDCDDPARARACILFLIQQNAEDGHTFAEEENLLARCESQFQMSHKTAQQALDELSGADLVVVEALTDNGDRRAIYFRDLHRAETGLANRLKALLSVPTPPVGINAEGIASEVHKKLAVQLSSEQLEVLARVLSHRIVIITGGPGTGKTTLIRSISAVFEATGKRILLAAPTGRAARRLAEVTRRPAGTLHRILGFNFTDGRFARNQDHPLEADVIIIDEASMVDTYLMYHFLQAVPLSAVLVLVGDIFQLPSIGPGSVLADMIHSGCSPVFYLKKIFRQDRQSSIIRNAHKVCQGEYPVFDTLEDDDGHADFFFIEEPDPDQAAARIVQLCCAELPRQFDLDPVRDIQVLTPMHKGSVGTINLNQLIQKALNPKPALIEVLGNAFKVGDKVMHLRNNYQKEVYNGDIGTISRIDPARTHLIVDYYDRTVRYDFDELDEITMAYAISVHKSQGSEYPAVIVPIMTQHYALLQRHLLYTAITRGQRLVILIGTQKALTIALKNDKPSWRLSKLAVRLNPDVAKGRAP
jgi:exodeoxyribonuclease V alpha subunit